MNTKPVVTDKKFRILVVDDDCDILELLKYNLEKEDFKVKTISRSARTIATARKFEPDLIILDLVMPDVNGIELCRKLRATKRFQNTYIFFLTARHESYYQSAAFNTGADDFIEKITGLRSLTHKVNAVLKRRFIIRKRIHEIRRGNVTIERASRSVNINGRRLLLNPAEFEVLFFMMQNAGKIVTLKTLINNIWGSETYLLDASADLYIRNLERKIGSGFIRKFQDQGYQFISTGDDTGNSLLNAICE